MNNSVFPEGVPQERKENILTFYSSTLIEDLYRLLDPMQLKFKIVACWANYKNETHVRNQWTIFSVLFLIVLRFKSLKTVYQNSRNLKQMDNLNL